MEQVYTPEDAARRLKIKPITVREYLRKGIIKGVKVGTKWRILDSDLQAYLDGLKAARDRNKE